MCPAGAFGDQPCAWKADRHGTPALVLPLQPAAGTWDRRLNHKSLQDAGLIDWPSGQSEEQGKNRGRTGEEPDALAGVNPTHLRV